MRHPAAVGLLTLRSLRFVSTPGFYVFVEMKLALLPFFLLLTASLAAQVNLPGEFVHLLDSLDLRFIGPLDSDYRESTLRSNSPYLPEQYALRSRRERLELRFHLRPERRDDRYYGMPHLAATTVAMNLGSNDEDAVTAVHQFGDEELAVLNADWARMYTFRPKRSFSSRQQAQLVAMYRAGRGMAYTVLLFDEAPNTLEGRQLSLRFR